MLETNNDELLRRYVVRGDDSSITVPGEMRQLMLRILGYQITGNIDDIKKGEGTGTFQAYKGTQRDTHL